MAGLVAITPACGWVGPLGAIVIGIAAGLASLWAVTALKARFNYDDSLDVFGVHGVAGMVGLLLTGIFVNVALGGTGVTAYAAADGSVGLLPYSYSAQVLAQAKALIVTAILSGVVSYVALRICKITFRLRVSEQEEWEGLDIGSHGERAYT